MSKIRKLYDDVIFGMKLVIVIPMFLLALITLPIWFIPFYLTCPPYIDEEERRLMNV